MTRALLLLALVACGKDAAKPPPPPTYDVTIPGGPPPVGLVIAEDSSQQSTMTLKRGDEATELREDEAEMSESTVLAVVDGAITRVRIWYKRKQTTRHLGGEDTVEKSPLEGNTYEVWVEGGEIKAARTDGVAVSDAEATALAEAHGSLGKVPALSRIFSERGWNLGEKVELPATKLAGLSEDPRIRVSAGTFTCKSSKDGTVFFDDQVSMTKDDAQGRIETVLKGDVMLDLATGRPLTVTNLGSSSGELRGEMAGTTLVGSTYSTTTYQYR